MTIVSSTGTIKKWEVSCDFGDCKELYIDKNAETMKNGFVKIKLWYKGEFPYYRHYCPRCAPLKIEELKDADEPYKVIS